jgi:hypothetical protein
MKMFRAILPMIFLAACRGTSPSPDGPAEAFILSGRVVMGEGAPVAGAAVSGRGFLDLGDNLWNLRELGTTMSTGDGRFSLNVPAEFVRMANSRECWSWHIEVHAEHGELLEVRQSGIESWSEGRAVTVCFAPVPPGLVEKVTRRMEELRTSPRKKVFQYGYDPVADYVDSTGEEEELFNFLHRAAERSRSVRELLKKYEKDRDENVRALAYEVLAQEWECEDDAGVPLRGESKDGNIEWWFANLSNSKHGGHYEEGIDLDDICPRCSQRFERLHAELWSLTPERIQEILQKHRESGDQAEILCRILEEVIQPSRRVIRRQPKPARRPDMPVDLPSWVKDPSVPVILVSLSDGLSLVRADGGGAAKLNPADLDLKAPRWSPDGWSIAGYGYFLTGIGHQNDIWVIDLKEGMAHRVTWDNRHEWRPLWLPDGCRLLFTRGSVEGQDFFILDLKTRKVDLLASFGGYVDDVSFSPEGGRLAFSPGNRDEPRLFRLDLPSRSITPISWASDRLFKPSWFPDGERLACLGRGDHGVAPRPFVQSSRGGRPAATNDYPFWSPDGKKTVVTEPGWIRIESEGKPVVRVQFPPASDVTVDWSMDGSQLAVVSMPEGEDGDLFVVNAETGSIRNLGVKGAKSARWRPLCR